jgi:hypothetical protein
MQFVALGRAKQLALREHEIMCNTWKLCNNEGAPYQQPLGQTIAIETVLVLVLVLVLELVVISMAMVQRLAFEAAYLRFGTRLNSDIPPHELGNCGIVACLRHTRVLNYSTK